MLGEVGRPARRHRAPRPRRRARRVAGRRRPLRVDRRRLRRLRRSRRRASTAARRACPAASRSPDFTGLHRDRARALAAALHARGGARPPRGSPRDVARLRTGVAKMEIEPLEYSLRAHEVLEDAPPAALRPGEPVERRRARGAARRRAGHRASCSARCAPMIARRDPGGALPQARSALRRLAARSRALERPDGVAAALGPRSPSAERELIAGLTAGAAEQLAYVPELVDPRPPRPAAAASFGEEPDERAGAASCGGAAALGAGAAASRPGLGSAASGRLRRRRRRPRRREADRRSTAPTRPGILTPAPAARDLRRLRRHRRRRAPSSPTGCARSPSGRRALTRRLRRAARRPGRGADARLAASSARGSRPTA